MIISQKNIFKEVYNSQLLGLHKSPCSNAQREILSKPIEHDNVPSWFQTTESLVSISTA